MVNMTIEQRIRNDLLTNGDIGPEIERVLLFGSAARRSDGPESDIDLVVVLKRRGMSPSYAAMLENRLRVSRALATVRRERALDVLAYTHDEWEHLQHTGSSFFRQIAAEARELV